MEAETFILVMVIPRCECNVLGSDLSFFLVGRAHGT